MKTFEVVIEKPSKIKDWDLWDEEFYRKVPYTTAILTAFDQDKLKVKVEKLYGEVKVLSVTEIELW